MKNKFFILFAFFVGIIWRVSSQTNLNGTWENVDPNTAGITKIDINNDSIHIWKHCKPKDCDWGYEKIVYYEEYEIIRRDSMYIVEDSNMAKRLNAIAKYKSKNANYIVVLREDDNDRLRVETFTEYIDNSDRPNFLSYESFKRIRYIAF